MRNDINQNLTRESITSMVIRALECFPLISYQNFLIILHGKTKYFYTSSIHRRSSYVLVKGTSISTKNLNLVKGTEGEGEKGKKDEIV